jgi:hypothetical protein
LVVVTILTDSEADKLQTAITQILGGDWTHAGAMLFASALRDMSLQEALDAVGEWVGQPHEFKKITPGDINQLVRKARSKKLPSESEIGLLAEKQGIGADDYFLWRRRLILGMTRNHESLEQASRAAVETVGTPRTIEAKREETQQQVDWRNVGRGVK